MNNMNPMLALAEIPLRKTARPRIDCVVFCINPLHHLGNDQALQAHCAQ